MDIANTLKCDTNPHKTKIRLEDPLAVAKFSWDMNKRLNKLTTEKKRPLIMLCIGTDRSTGDCLGPLTGEKLDAANENEMIVYGTLEQPVHASNLQETISEIKRNFDNPIIIAIDACLGSAENIGCIQIGEGSLQPGAGVNKNLPSVGDLHITGVVNVGGFLEYMVLQNTRLNIVMKMSSLIAKGIQRALHQQKNCQTKNDLFFYES